jgi:flagellar transcriptional activator FlhD
MSSAQDNFSAPPASGKKDHAYVGLKPRLSTTLLCRKLDRNHLERAVLKENSGMLRAISEFNRSYLLLAQRALRQGDIKGGQLLGVSDETAVLISQLTEAQIENLSNRSDLLCEIRLSDPAHLMARI